MPERRFFEYEAREDEPFGTLHIRIPIRRRLMPQSAARHLRNAVKEGLLAVRALLDEAIQGLERDRTRPAAG
ncbi:MAG: hypothetical protein C4315_10200 [Chloroflexota bacterium]